MAKNDYKIAKKMTDFQKKTGKKPKSLEELELDKPDVEKTEVDTFLETDMPNQEESDAFMDTLPVEKETPEEFPSLSPLGKAEARVTAPEFQPQEQDTTSIQGIPQEFKETPQAQPITPEIGAPESPENAEMAQTQGQVPVEQQQATTAQSAQAVSAEDQRENDIMAKYAAIQRKQELDTLNRKNIEEEQLIQKENEYKDEIEKARQIQGSANVFKSGTIGQKIMAGLALALGTISGDNSQVIKIMKQREDDIIKQNQDIVDKYTDLLGDVNKAKIAVKKDYYDTMDSILEEKKQFASPTYKMKMEAIQQDIALKNAKINEYIRSKVQQPVTKGQEATDKEFAKEYVKWTAGGGSAAIVKNLSQLNTVIKRLKDSDMISGPIVSLLPDALRKRIPGIREGMDTQQLIEEVVQRNLRETLGAQFTEREGMMLIKRAFDPAQPEEVNAKRVRRLVRSVENVARAKQRASEYFKKYGTLSGYPATTDFESQVLRENALNPIGFEEE